jgi:hypothetical protein
VKRGRMRRKGISSSIKTGAGMMDVTGGNGRDGGKGGALAS